MMSFVWILAQAAGGGQPAGGGEGGGGAQAPPAGGLSSMLIFLVMIFAIMYIFLILPQRRKQRQHQQMLASLKKNDRVITIGGIHGVVHSIKDDKIVLKVDDNAKLTFSLSSVASVERKEEPEEKKDS